MKILIVDDKVVKATTPGQLIHLDESIQTRAALDAASDSFDLGTEGAGTGALCEGLKGGLGSASAVLGSGVTVGGVVIVATGMDVYDPTALDEYGYTRYPNVITSMEFERLICAGGPTVGHFVRPGDHAVPRRIGFIQCVGSRNPKIGNPYCSNICCMNTVKDTLLIRDHYPDSECTVFYLDIRAFGKGFEDLYMRSKEEGVRYIRGIPGKIEEDPSNPRYILTVWGVGYKFPRLEDLET